MRFPPRGRVFWMLSALLAVGGVAAALSFDRPAEEPVFVPPPMRSKFFARAEPATRAQALDDAPAPPGETFVTLATPQGDEIILEAATKRVVAIRNGRTRKAFDPFTLAPIPELDPGPMPCGPAGRLTP